MVRSLPRWHTWLSRICLVLLGSLSALGVAEGEAYPGCVEERVVLRHAGAHGIFVDITFYGSTGCWLDDCRSTDKFAAADKGVCARACADIEECEHWSFGEQEGVSRCFLRKSDGGRDNGVDGFVSGTKACVPEPLPGAFVGLAVANLDALRVCDAGKSQQCPDMGKAIQTWRFAISNLKRGAEGYLDENTMLYIHQIESDTDAFHAQMSEENFPVVVANNRQVFDALAPWMATQPQPVMNAGDMSLPNPLRGHLCSAISCFT